jgi:AcrR family transcriptional regulator
MLHFRANARTLTPLVQTRVLRSATPEKRRRILDAVEAIMLRDGYAAVTTRRVEAEAGLKLHYHFGTLDELFVAVVRRHGERNVALLAEAFASPEPIRGWWRLLSETRGNALLVELTAAANHRPALQAEVAAFAREVHRIQIESLDARLDDYGIDRDAFPSALIAAAMQGLSFSMAHDKTARFDTGHEEASAAMTRLVDRLETERAGRRTGTAKRSRTR